MAPESPGGRTIVLGGSGFIGGQLVAHLRRAHRQVASFGSRNFNLRDASQTAANLAGICANADIVFCPSISRLEEDSPESFAQNVRMLRNALDAAIPQRPRSYCFLSSADVYGLPAAELPISEATPLAPDTHYGRSKAACEDLLREAARGVCPAAILRLPGVYGPGDRGRSIVGGLAGQIARGETVRLTNRGRTLRDYVHASDVCDIVAAWAEQPVDLLLNGVTGQSATTHEWAHSVAAALGAQLRCELLAERGPRDHDLVFDAAQLFAFRAARGLGEPTGREAGVRRYVEQERCGA